MPTTANPCFAAGDIRAADDVVHPHAVAEAGDFGEAVLAVTSFVFGLLDSHATDIVGDRPIDHFAETALQHARVTGML